MMSFQVACTLARLGSVSGTAKAWVTGRVPSAKKRLTTQKPRPGPPTTRSKRGMAGAHKPNLTSSN